MATVGERKPGRETLTTGLKWGIPLVVVAALLTAGIHAGTCPSQRSIWIRYLIGGLRSGAIYAMIALGYTMVYGVLQLLNFAHSEIFMIGTFAGLYAIKGLFGVTANDPPTGVFLVFVIIVVVVLAALASGITAVAMERVAYRPLRRRGASRLAYLITAIGVSLTLSNLFLLLDGHKHLGLPVAWPAIGGPAGVSYPTTIQHTPVFSVAGVPVDRPTVLVLVVAVAMLIVLDRFVHGTRTGQGI